MEEEDLNHRANAFVLHGEPISHLPTARVFAYATHYEVTPMGLEWIDDTTCVLVFDNRTDAREAYNRLKKSAEQAMDDDGYYTAKAVPLNIWPIEERLTKLLGKSEGLAGTVRMRWATSGDVKKKGAKVVSEFYKKHGENAGKEVYRNGEMVREGPVSRKRRRGDEDEASTRARLDAQLDSFLEERPRRRQRQRQEKTQKELDDELDAFLIAR